MKKKKCIIILCILVFIFSSPVKTGKLTGIYTVIHRGTDIALSIGTSVYATAGGTVIFAGFGETKGNYVVISHGLGFDSRYLHLESIAVNAGQQVKKGTLVGLSGNTGKSTGPHLHFEICFFSIPLPPSLFCLPNMVVGAVVRFFSQNIKKLLVYL